MAGPIPGVAITAPKPLEPHAGETLTFSSEPPTLLIENAGSSGVRAIWLQLEVSTDSGFSQLVHQADQITPGANGRSTYRLPEPLGAGFTYFWRTRASDTTGWAALKRKKRSFGGASSSGTNDAARPGAVACSGQ